MSATGYIQVHAYTSNAQIPLQDTTVTISDNSGAAIAMRLTNRSGQFNTPVPIPVPDLSASQSPNTGVIPFATVRIYAKAEDYEEIDVENVQVFADTITQQNLELIPMSELPEKWNKAEQFIIPPQNL